MMRLLAALVVVGALVLLGMRAEPFAPTVTLDPVATLGRATPLHLVAHDRGTGLASVELRLVPENGAPVVLAQQTFPRQSWFGSGVHEAEVTPTVDASAAKVPEGRAELQVWAIDHSWLAGLHRGPRLTQSVTIDLTPPMVEIPPGEHVARLGGAECVVYKASADTARDGVEVGPRFFPGVAGLFADPNLRVSLFAVSQDTPEAQPAVMVADAAGNVRRQTFGVVVTPRRFADKTMPLTADFLAKKVPELLQANNMPSDGDLVAGYIRINRDLRVATEKRLQDLCRDSLPTPRWQGAFERLPNAAALSSFADRRRYVYDGKEIDHQTHLGFDLASLKGSAVPAGNAGRVVFAGPLGIYGNTVVLDHGLGLFSLYGHLSSIAVAVGTEVARGDMVGNTGDTGLAGGDHLHFSVMIRGFHVDPVEWWDAHWIRDHVDSRLDAFPRAGTAK